MNRNVVARVLVVLVYMASTYFQYIRRNRASHVIVQLIPSVFTIIRRQCAVASIAVNRINPVLYVCFMDYFNVITALCTTSARIMHDLFIFGVRQRFNFWRYINQLPICFIVRISTFYATAFVRACMLARSEFFIAFLSAGQFAWDSIFGRDCFRIVHGQGQDAINYLFRRFPYQPVM